MKKGSRKDSRVDENKTPEGISNIYDEDREEENTDNSARRPISAPTDSEVHLEDINSSRPHPSEFVASSSFSDRSRMARKIVDFEARRDAQGRIAVYRLRPEDGGGRYEVAGINERYHKEEADLLVALIESGRHDEAESYAAEFIANYTDVADRWCRTTAVEFYLRDCVFNRGPGGAAWIVQHAVGVETDRIVGPLTRDAIARAEQDPARLLERLRASRETYERQRRDESSPFWRGLVNRWDNASAFALTFLGTPADTATAGVMAAAVNATGGDAASRILNCEPSQEVEDDWRTDAALEAGILRAAYVPDEVDLREPWWQIGDQGRTGSCVGWATADSVLRWHFVRSGRITQNVPLSTRFIWVAAKETDEFSTRPTTFIEEAGTSLKSALDVARKLGVVTADVLPFDREQLFQGQEASFYARAAQLKIASYINLGTDLSNWRLWLYQNGPILTRLVVDRNFMRAAELKGRLSEYDEASAAGGHAVALVGYTRDGFIVRNSWSPTWGHQGFAFATNAYAQRAFTEAYGVNV